MHAQAGRLLVGDAFLFPAPRAKPGDPPKAWDRYRARALLRRCEKAAKLAPQVGTDWHGFRRAWASSRKHLPDRDVAACGGWKDLRSLQTAYQQTDERTVLAVMLDPTRVREIKVAAD